MNKVILFLLIFLFLPVCNSLIITPESQSLEVYRGVDKTFQLSLFNDMNFTAYNLTFSNLSNFVFPQNINISSNSSVTLSYSVHTSELFQSVFVSTVSFFYVSDYTPPLTTKDVNISSAFDSVDTVIMVNDSIRWNNKLSREVEIRNLGGGFSTVNIPALSSVTVQYQSVNNYGFFEVTGGFTGTLGVVDRTNTTLVHDSSKDKLATFSLHSVLNPSALSAGLVGSLSLNNNQSTTGYLRIINNDQNTVITNIHLSADRWITNFSEQDFTLQASTPSVQSSKLISFTVQPYVSKTNDTNVSQNVVVTLTSANAGNVSNNIGVFINFMNMDFFSANGSIYYITRLGVQETAEFCARHPTDGECVPLFEACLKSGVCKNQTVIHEIPALVTLTENDIKDFVAQEKISGESQTRLENIVSRYVDEQNSVNEKVDNVSQKFLNMNDKVDTFMVRYSDDNKRLKIIIWTIISLLIVSGLLVFVSWVLREINYFDALEKSGQV